MLKRILLILLFIGATSVPSWASFTYYSPFTVAAAQITGTLTNFTVVVKPTDNRFKTTGGHVLNSNGYDLRPYSDSSCTTAITTYYLVPGTYSSTTGTFEMWILFSSIANGSVFYMCYGDAALNTDGSSGSTTWNSTNIGIALPLPDGTTLSVTDATGQQTTTNHSATATTGQIDGGAAFNGSTQWIGVNNASSLSPGTGNFFMCTWASTTDKTVAQALYWNYGADTNNLVMLRINSSKFEAYFRDSGGTNVANPVDNTTTIANNTKYMVCGVRNGTTGRLYTNGSQVATDTPAALNTIDTTGAMIELGIGSSGTGTGTPSVFLSGSEDHIVAGKSDPTSNGIAAMYNNQSAPTSFWTLGNEVPIVAGSTCRMTLLGVGC